MLVPLRWRAPAYGRDVVWPCRARCSRPDTEKAVGGFRRLGRYDGRASCYSTGQREQMYVIIGCRIGSTSFCLIKGRPITCCCK